MVGRDLTEEYRSIASKNNKKTEEIIGLMSDLYLSEKVLRSL